MFKAAVRMVQAALAYRVLMAAAFLGAFLLAGVVMFRADWASVIGLVIYCVATILPVTIIEMRRS